MDPIVVIDVWLPLSKKKKKIKPIIKNDSPFSKRLNRKWQDVFRLSTRKETRKVYKVSSFYNFFFKIYMC